MPSCALSEVKAKDPVISPTLGHSPAPPASRLRRMVARRRLSLSGSAARSQCQDDLGRISLELESARETRGSVSSSRSPQDESSSPLSERMLLG